MDSNNLNNGDRVKDLFAGITSPTGMESPEDGESAATKIQQDVAQKNELAKTELDRQESEINSQLSSTRERVEVISQDSVGNAFKQRDILNGWFTPAEIRDAEQKILARIGTKLTVDTASQYGIVSDSVVQSFINSASTKATGEARFLVAAVLDRVTGVSKDIAKDKSVEAENIERQAQKLIKVWKNAEALDKAFRRFFSRTLNRVVTYQDRLAGAGVDLSKKQVVLENISASMMTRRQNVLQCLFDTLVSGMALEEILKNETNTLNRYLAEKEQSGASQSWTYKIQEQESLVQVISKRLVDLKAFAIKLIGLHSVLGSTKLNVAIINADVLFARTNLMATLGLQLGLVADIISTLRISEAAANVRTAEAEASEKVGVASTALNEAGTKALTDVTTTLRSLNATVTAAVEGIKNTHENMARVQEMATNADREFAGLFAKMSE